MGTHWIVKLYRKTRRVSFDRYEAERHVLAQIPDLTLAQLRALIKQH